MTKVPSEIKSCGRKATALASRPMSSDALIPIVIGGLILASGLLLHFTHRDPRARMTEKEREAEDASQDSDQIW